MSNDPDFEKQIRKSAERIISLKHEYLAFFGGQNTTSEGSAQVNMVSQQNNNSKNSYSIPAEGASSFFYQQAFRSVSLLHRDKLIKTPNKNEKILLAGPLRLFFEEGLKRFPNADTYFFPYNPYHTTTENNSKKLHDIASGYDTVIFCSANSAGIEILKTLKNNKCRVIVLSVLSPASLSSLSWLDGGVAVYGTGRESFTAGFAVIAGDFIPEGVLPISTKENN